MPGRLQISWLSGALACLVVIAMAVTVAMPVRAYRGAVRLLGTTVGVGPSFDGFGLSIPLLFNGTVVPAGDAFHTVPYPAQINLNYPIVSQLPVLSGIPYWPQSLTQSERVGAGYLEQDVANHAAGDRLTVIGYSQGAQVAEIARADMARNPAYTDRANDYEFVLVGDPYQPNGGILARFTSWADVPLLGDIVPFGRPGPSDSPFRTTYYQNQYDGFADFPAYFNLLAVVNAVAGIVVEHVLPGYVFAERDAPNVVSTTVGNTTYVTIPHRLPLLVPLRLAASLIGAQRLVDAMDPIMRVFVEMGYDRTADPSRVMEFAWRTPQDKIRAALDALPGAVAQSVAILHGASFTPSVPTPVVAADEPPTPVTAHPALPVDDSPKAQAVRHALVGLTAGLNAATQSVAKLLRGLGGHTQPEAPAPSPTVTATDAGPVTTDAEPTATADAEPATTEPVRRARTHDTTTPSRAAEAADAAEAAGAADAAEAADDADTTSPKNGAERPRSARHDRQWRGQRSAPPGLRRIDADPSPRTPERPTADAPTSSPSGEPAAAASVS